MIQKMYKNNLLLNGYEFGMKKNKRKPKKIKIACYILAMLILIQIYYSLF